MESPILKQIVKFLQTRKKQKQWMVVFVFMAVIVGVGTVTALKMMGQAMTRKEHVLDCQLQVHQHTKGCYDGNDNLVCGYADYVVHKHNDDCYNSEGKLVCRLPEVEKHEHTKKCYEKTKTLVCGQEETVGHEHTDGCYTTQKGDLKCKTEEHSHSDGCYDEEGNLTCGKEEHQHNDDCYKYEDVLTCKIKEGEGGHKHTDKCYDVQEVLTCGKLEMHKHTDKCFEKIDKNGKDEPENLKLVCKKTELLEHTHTEDAGCLRTVDAAEADVIQAELDKEAEEAALGKAAEEGREIFTTDMNEEEENGEDAEAAEGEESEAAEGEDAANPEGETAEGEDGAAADEAEPETYEETKTYEGLGYIVTASYNKDANIPEEAKFVAERITKESGEEDYKKHEEEYKKSVGNENATMSALFKLGFYVNDEEVEPESPVMVTVQFVDKNGLPEGAPIKVVHFGDDKTEVIKGSKAESGSTSFKTDGFSIFGFGPDEDTDEVDEADTEKVSVPISKTAEYTDDVFSATFTIEGNIEVSEKIAESIQAGEGKNGTESSGETSSKEEGTTGEEPIEEKEEISEKEPAEEETAEEGAAEEEQVEEEEGTPEEEPAEESKDAAGNEALKFEVKPLDVGSSEYQETVEKIKRFEEEDQMLRCEMMSYSLSYKGEEIDLSGCKVTATVTTAQTLADKMNETSVPDTVRQVITDKTPVMEIGENTVKNGTGIMIRTLDANQSSVENLGDAYLNPGAAVEPIECEYSNARGKAVMYAAVRTDTLCTVQYYAYAQTWAKSKPSDGDSIKVINTSKQEDVKGQAALPNNWTTPNTKLLHVKAVGSNSAAGWPRYEPAYEQITDTSSLTQLYATNRVNSSVVVSNNGLDSINKFAKEGLNFGLYELWVLNEGKSSDSTEKSDWTIYDKEKIKNLKFTNLEGSADASTLLITEDTVLRLVGMRNEDKNKIYPANFFDYDFTNGSPEKADRVLKGINDPDNYEADGNGNVKKPQYGFGNGSSGTTGLDQDQIEQNGSKYNMNIARTPANTIIEKCCYGLVQNSLVGGYPKINANAPDLFNPDVTQKGKTNISGYSLNFIRNGDTYTLSSVKGAGEHASNLNEFQKKGQTWDKKDMIWTNQFWPMDASGTFGDTANGHDPKFGDATMETKYGLISSDDGKLHNSFFGMSFGVEFTLTEDYVGPLNYYFFGDDDMWVFLEHPGGKTELICDIGGTHQAAGEYVNLWNYIQKPSPDGTDTAVSTNTEERGKTYKLKFFYTERGASGSTCWMQFTLPSVNTVPVDSTGDAKSTLTLSKTVDGELTDEIKNTAFEFVFTLKNQETQNQYQYSIKNENGNEVSSGWIKSGGTFRLKHNQSFYVYRLPNGAEYEITENVNTSDYQPVLGAGSTTGTIESGTTVGGDIDYDRDDNVNLINHQLYQLPETGGSGLMIYTIAGALCILLSAGFMYRKKLGKGGSRISSGN